MREATAALLRLAARVAGWAAWRRRAASATRFLGSRRRAAVIGAAGLASMLGAGLGFGPLVRSRVAKLAEARGLIVEVARVRPALGGVRLAGVRLRAAGTAWISGELDRIDVMLGWSLGLRAVSIEGGRIELEGSVEDVRDQVRKLTRAGDKAAERPGRSATAAAIRAEALRLRWVGLAGAKSELSLEGARAEQHDDADGATRSSAGATTLRMSGGPVHAAARDLSVQLRRAGPGPRVTEARVKSLEIDIPLGGAKARPSAAPGSSTQGPARASYFERAPAVATSVASLAVLASDHVEPGAPVRVDALAFVITRGDEQLNLGPGALRVERRADAVELDFAPGQGDFGQGPRRAGLRLHLRAPSKPGPISLNVEGGPVTLAALGVHERDFGLLDVGRATLEARANVELDATGRRLSFEGDGRLRSVSLVHPALAEDPVRGLELGWGARGAVELDGSLVRIEGARIELGAIRVEGSASIENAADHVRIDGRANVPISECQRMFESLPPALVPKLAGMKMAGVFSLRAGLSVDSRRPDDLSIDWDLRNRCRVKNAPPDVDVARFSRPFRRVVYDEHGDKMDAVSGPGTPDWVPLRAISPFLELAVTTTEDGGFRSHGGFDGAAIKNSIRDNLRAGRFLRGASTISMQLAKNLYLEREKSLSRKLQEAILTTYLEQSLTKDEILELYFNVVEFGPNLYGIGPAAAHYFDTSATDSSLGQSLFLTSILPSPKRTYFSPAGQVTKGWGTYLKRLMRIMRDRKKINDQELFDGISEVITFRVARSPRVRPSLDMQRELGSGSSWLAPDGP